MFGIGKKTAWNAWEGFTDVTDTFITITQDPSCLTLDSLHMQRLERLTVMMYSKHCGAKSVNEARKLMFSNGLKSLDCIPATQHALFYHAKRALHASAIVWGQSLSTVPTIDDPSDWGWEWNVRTKLWVPY